MSTYLQPQPPDQVFEQLEQVIDYAQELQASDRRQADRTVIYLPVLIEALDENYQPVGEVIAGLSRNVSVSGLAFLIVEHLECSFATIRFELNDRQLDPLFVEIVHQQQRGPFYDIGVKLVMDWEGGQW